MALKENFSLFCRTSAIRGLSRAAKEPFGFIRILWCFAVLIGGGVALLYLLGLIRRYFEYPTSLQIREHQKYGGFPDITICNLQPFNTSLPYNTLKDLEDNHIKQVERVTRENYTQLDWGLHFLQASFSTIIGFYQNVPQEQLAFLHQSPHEFFVQCNWEGWVVQGSPTTPCHRSDGKWFSHPDHGRCYRVQFNLTVRPDFEGDINSLKLILFIDDFLDYSFDKLVVPDTGPWQGVALHIHERDTYFDYNNKLLFQPGTSSVLELERLSTESMSEPYGICEESENVTLSDGTDTGYRYTAESCFSFCLQEVFNQHCNCSVVYFPLTNKKGESFPLCGNLTYFEQINIQKQALEDLLLKCFELAKNGSCSKKCKVPCKSEKFTPTVHQADWPHPSYQLQFYRNVIKKELPNKKHLFKIYDNISDLIQQDPKAGMKWLRKTDLIRKNFLEINIKLASAFVTVLKETDALTVDAIVGNLGGIFNLWIGVSFVTLFEILELLYRICRDMFTSENKVGNNKKDKWAERRNTESVDTKY